MTGEDWYIAGLLEGEGCFGMRGAGAPRATGHRFKTAEIALGMTDKDVVERVSRIWGTPITVLPRPNPKHSTIYRTRLTGARALAVMVTIYPQMGARRRNKIEECLTQWEHGHRPRWGVVPWQKRKHGACATDGGIRFTPLNIVEAFSAGGSETGRLRDAR